MNPVSLLPHLVRTYIHTLTHTSRVQLGYNVIKGTEYFVSLLTSAIITENYNMMVNR